MLKRLTDTSLPAPVCPKMLSSKIADAFEVSMDYLVGEGVNPSFDKKNLKRLQDIEKLDTDVKDKIYFVIDNIIQNVIAKKALAS
ncbi:MAG: hypothetical protein SGI83_09190 [Bacteroidota bacterium]|nr:hypothetical protein [Bacteroidota bacterium]